MSSSAGRGGSLTIPALWIASGRTIAFGLTFLLPLLLVRRLDQSEYGLYKEIFLIISTGMNILPLGFHMTAFYFLPRESDRKAQVVLNILLFHSCAAAAGCLILATHPELLNLIFPGANLAGYGLMIGLVLLLWVASFPLEYIAMASEQAKLATVFIISNQVVGTLLMLGAALGFGSLRALITAAIIQGVWETSVLVIYLMRRFDAFSVLAAGFDWMLFRSQIAYAIPLGLAGLIWSMQLQVHQYFVANRFSPAAYALYAVGTFQLPLIGILSDSVGSVMIARVSRLQKDGQPREIILLTARMVRKLAAVYLPICAFLLVVGPAFIAVLFTTRYADSWPIFAVNLMFIPLAIFSSAFDPIMRAYPEHRYFLLKVRITILALLIAALWFATDRFGPIGVILAAVAVNLIERVVVGSKAARILGATWHDIRLFKDVAKVMAAAIAAAVAAALLTALMAGAAPLSVILAAGLVFCVVYVAGAWVLGVVSNDERARLLLILGQASRLALWKQPDRSVDMGSTHLNP
jgi:O-antigen/teichoic acid export membrane protein